MKKIKIKCPDCNATGWVVYWLNPKLTYFCSKCSGTGYVYWIDIYFSNSED